MMTLGGIVFFNIHITLQKKTNIEAYIYMYFMDPFSHNVTNCFGRPLSVNNAIPHPLHRYRDVPAKVLQNL